MLQINNSISGFLSLSGISSIFIMNEKFIRHFISVIAVFIAFFIWLSGYVSGTHGWWWVAFGAIAFYFIVYTLLEV